jgi:3-oxoacyl-[acyl-carrier protein] reductase
VAGAIGSDFQTTFERQTPLGRIGQVSDITPLAVFLASNDSGWLTGETLVASRRTPPIFQTALGGLCETHGN